MSAVSASKSIVRYARLLYEKEMIAGYDGNLSIKIGQNRVIITPSGLPKGFLRLSDLVTVDLSGKTISGKLKASSELAMHLEVYKNRPDIAACCHAHPPFATAFAATGKNLPKNSLPEVILSVGEIKLAEYIPTGLASAWKKLGKYLRDCNAILLKNHGVLTIGKSLDEAYFRMETVEHFARIAWYGKNLGGLKQLGKHEVTRLANISNRHKK